MRRFKLVLREMPSLSRHFSQWKEGERAWSCAANGAKIEVGLPAKTRPRVGNTAETRSNVSSTTTEQPTSNSKLELSDLDLQMVFTCGNLLSGLRV